MRRHGRCHLGPRIVVAGQSTPLWRGTLHGVRRFGGKSKPHPSGISLAPMSSRAPSIVVGFDLDMTLIDTRARIRRHARGARRRARGRVSDVGRPPLQPRPAARPDARSASRRGGDRSPRRPVPRALPRPLDRPGARARPARTRRSPPYAVTAAAPGGDRQVHPQRPAAPRRTSPSTSTTSRARSGASARPRASQRGRFGLRRRPRPRRRRCPRCRRHQRLRADRRQHRARSCSRRAPTSSSTDLDDFPAWLDEHVLDLRLAALEERLRALGSVLVAFSGGADSALLLAAAVRALGADHVAAGTGVLRLAAGRRARPGPRVRGPRSASRCSPRTRTRWSARATAPTPATAATSARPS